MSFSSILIVWLVIHVSIFHSLNLSVSLHLPTSVTSHIHQSVCISIHLSFHPSVNLSFYPCLAVFLRSSSSSTCLLLIHLSVCPSIHICLFLHLLSALSSMYLSDSHSLHLLVLVSLHPPLSVSPSICLSVCLSPSICMSVCLSPSMCLFLYPPACVH